MFGKKKVVEKVVLTDLLNDLVREEDVKRRVLEQLSMPIDRPRQFGVPGQPGMPGQPGAWATTSAVMSTFSSLPAFNGAGGSGGVGAEGGNGFGIVAGRRR